MAATAAGKSTIREEIKVGRTNTPAFAWPTVVLALVLLATFAASVWLALRGSISYLASACINGVVIYSIYTVVHEAVHNNISSHRHDLRWVDSVLGHMSCFLLWQFMDHHRESHLEHHKHTNEDSDPDINARATLAGYLFVRLPVALLNYFNPYVLYQECKRFDVPRDGIRRTFIAFGLNTAVLAGLLVAGYGYEVLVLWFIPWWIGQSIMLTLFTWSPHHDHWETGRYRNSRISEFPGANWLLLGQGYHLIHHMMPAVPWYRYKRTFDQLRPILRDNGVRIEGLQPMDPGTYRSEPVQQGAAR